MTNAQCAQTYDVIWDGRHAGVDRDLLRWDLAIPEKIQSVAVLHHLAGPPRVVTAVHTFLLAQARDRWWTVAEIAAPLRQHRESVRSALRILGAGIERRALDRSSIRSPRWAYRWHPPCDPA